MFPILSQGPNPIGVEVPELRLQSGVVASGGCRRRFCIRCQILHRSSGIQNSHSTYLIHIHIHTHAYRCGRVGLYVYVCVCVCVCQSDSVGRTVLIGMRVGGGLGFL